MPYSRVASSALFGTLAALALSASIALPGNATAATPPAMACAEKTGCEAKFCRIQTEIDYAKAHGNSRKEAGLKKALEEARASCTTESLAAERAEKIRERQEEVIERQDELREAQEDGRTRKIERAQKKLKEAQDKLAEAQKASD